MMNTYRKRIAVEQDYRKYVFLSEKRCSKGILAVFILGLKMSCSVIFINSPKLFNK